MSMRGLDTCMGFDLYFVRAQTAEAERDPALVAVLESEVGLAPEYWDSSVWRRRALGGCHLLWACLHALQPASHPCPPSGVTPCNTASLTLPSCGPAPHGTQPASVLACDLAVPWAYGAGTARRFLRGERWNGVCGVQA
jgi:hypothetical protein